MVKYHQVGLGKDASFMELNYVEMAMGDTKQIIKFINLILSILVSTEAKKDFIPIIMNLPE